MAGVEPWVCGCWRRDSITFRDGVVDRATQVIWVQSGRYCGDIRVPPGRARPEEAQASLSQCHMTGDSAVWDRELAFHPKRHFPEPGLLSLEGDLMTERAPSGAYEEIWRRQSGSDGVRAAYALEGSRGGRLVIAGDHLYLAIDRPTPLAGDATLQEMLADGAAPDGLFDCEFSYAERVGSDYVIRHSTDAAKEGERLAAFSDPTFVQATVRQADRIWRRLNDGRD